MNASKFLDFSRGMVWRAFSSAGTVPGMPFGSSHIRLNQSHFVGMEWAGGKLSRARAKVHQNFARTSPGTGKAYLQTISRIASPFDFSHA